MFFKYYKHLFRFYLSIDSYEAEAQYSLDTALINDTLGKTFTTNTPLEIPSEQNISWRLFDNEIPEWTQFTVQAHRDENITHVARIIIIHEKNSHCTTEVNVSWEELKWIIKNSQETVVLPSTDSLVESIIKDSST